MNPSTHCPCWQISSIILSNLGLAQDHPIKLAHRKILYGCCDLSFLYMCRWLMLNNREKKAKKVLKMLLDDGSVDEKLKEIKESIASTKDFTEYKLLFKWKNLKR